MQKKDDLCHIFDISLFKLDDLDVLLHEVLKQIREILNCEAGSIYICEDEALCFNVFQNDAMSYENIYRQFYSLKDLKLPLSEEEKYLAVKSFVSKKIILIDDVYQAEEFDFLGVKEYDKRFQYRTHSIMSAPLIHPIDNKTIGVLQVINKQDSDGKIIPFNEKDKQLLSMCCSFITLAISNAQNSIEKLKEINEELEVANEKLQKRIKEEIKQNEKMNAIVYHQSKLASMGEMLGNIAHQWRQPLSAISTIASAHSFNIELDEFNKADTKKGLDQIVSTTKHLSQTIDDFRNFYKIDKEVREFNISKNLKQSLDITEASLSENHISIVLDLDETLEFTGYENELKQAILNIIQNARDALLENIDIQKDNRYIFIALEKENGVIKISIKDNAKGIPFDIIHKVFEKDFTTKTTNGGTGIGLFMTKQIIENHFSGTIEVSNSMYSYKGKECMGAEFIIKLYPK